MKKKIQFLLCGGMIVIFSACMERAPVPGFGFQLPIGGKPVKKGIQDFYMTVHDGTVEEIKVFLDKGYDPDYMNYPGALPWIDTNPLWFEVQTCNYEKAKLLIEYGANVTKRPYIAWVLNQFSSPIISETAPRETARNSGPFPIAEKKVYDMVKLLLESGASPNIKGWGASAMFFMPSDKKYLKYYEENGDLPINFAIEANAFSIVDLLIEHGAILDEQSLKVVDQSEDSEMFKKVTALWKAQLSDRTTVSQ